MADQLGEGDATGESAESAQKESDLLKEKVVDPEPMDECGEAGAAKEHTSSAAMKEDEDGLEAPGPRAAEDAVDLAPLRFDLPDASEFPSHAASACVEFLEACSFLLLFGQHIGIPLLSIDALDSALSNPVFSPVLIEIHVRLLRTCGLSVPDTTRFVAINSALSYDIRWERYIARFVERYDSEVASALESGGYGSIDPPTRAWILKILLEAQFDSNFRVLVFHSNLIIVASTNH